MEINFDVSEHDITQPSNATSTSPIRLDDFITNQASPVKEQVTIDSNETSELTAPKKRRKSLKDSHLKLKILDLISKGRKVTSLAVEYNVGASTIRDWMKSKDKILELDNLNKTCNLAKKTLKLSDYPQVDKALCIWYYQERALNRPISVSMTCEKAKYFKNFLDLDTTKANFSASYGFVTNFFLRHGFNTSNKFIIEPNESFKKNLNDLIKKENYLPEQIFILEEAGLYWKSLPNETFGPNSKDRIHFGLTFNCSGTFKLPLIIVNKTMCFDRSISKSSLPIFYAHHDKVWMAKNIFDEWFFADFVPKVEAYLKNNNLEAKALLLIENFAPRACLTSSSGLIKCIFRPTYSVDLIEQYNSISPLTWLKKAYKYDFIREIFICDKDADFLKNYSLKKCINFLALSWLKTPTSMLKSSWQKFDLNTDLKNTESDSNEVIELAKQLDFKQDEIKTWISSDLYENGYCVLDDSEIIKQVLGEQSIKIDENNKADDNSPDYPITSCSSVIKSVDTIVSWLESQKNLDPNFILKTLEIRDIACRKKLLIDKKTVENESVALLPNMTFTNQTIKTSHSESNLMKDLSKISDELRDEIISELSEPVKKRNKIVLDNKTRVEILEKIDSGKKINDLAAEYGCGATTIRDWIKVKHKIFENYELDQEQLKGGLEIKPKKLSSSSNKINKILTLD